MQSKPFSCQLNRVELFSSILSLEEETALSIVDPATISIEIVGKTSGSDTQGILEATSVQQVLEIQAQHLVFRLSYNDMKLFVRILDSLPRQVSSVHLSLLHLIYFYFINPFFCKCNFLCCMPCLVYVVVGMEPVNILTSHNLFNNCAHHFVMIGSDVLFIVLFVMGIQQFRELKDFWLQNCFRKRRKWKRWTSWRCWASRRTIARKRSSGTITTSRKRRSGSHRTPIRQIKYGSPQIWFHGNWKCPQCSINNSQFYIWLDFSLIHLLRSCWFFIFMFLCRFYLLFRSIWNLNCKLSVLIPVLIIMILDSLLNEMKGTNELKIRCVEVRTGCVSLCVIDDCRDADVPLLELTASSLLLRQMIEPFRKTGEGNITCQFAVEYYNRTLSGIYLTRQKLL